jgi:hypothetical protein
MIAHTHMFDRRTLTRILSIPCASVSMARQVAQAQRHTINIVESQELTAGYKDGELLFCTSDLNELRQWITKLGLKEPCQPSWKKLTIAAAKFFA